ncbi:MAG: hypothetical protein HND48_01260 [Chloroflexi bacterium]|nr:hypothetical protein [Chloroflexota bacterium]
MFSRARGTGRRGWEADDWCHTWSEGRKLISGWDVARNQPKPLRHYIPAGSVFFFEDAQWKGERFTETPDNEVSFSAIGFGQVALGSW